MKISMYWADVHELMKNEGYDKFPMNERYHKFTVKLEEMFRKEFPNQTIKIDWRD
jgi:hypothetical protein